MQLDDSLWWFEEGILKYKIYTDWCLFEVIQKDASALLDQADGHIVFEYDMNKTWGVFKKNPPRNVTCVYSGWTLSKVPKPILLAMTLMGIQYD